MAATQWCIDKATLKFTFKTPSPIYDTLKHGIRSWQEGNPDPQWPFSIPSVNDFIVQAIFLAYTKQSSKGWSHTLCRYLSLHWRAAMSTYMQYRSHTRPSSLLNGPGYSYRPYMSTHTAGGLTTTTPSMGPHLQPLGPHTTFSLWLKSQKHNTIAPQFPSTNCLPHCDY